MLRLELPMIYPSEMRNCTLFLQAGSGVTTMSEVLQDMDTYQKVDGLMRICRSAVRGAQAESRRLGVANVYFINGQLYYELPNGEFSRKRPTSTKRGGAHQSLDQSR